MNELLLLLFLMERKKKKRHDSFQVGLHSSQPIFRPKYNDGLVKFSTMGLVSFVGPPFSLPKVILSQNPRMLGFV